MTFFVGKKFLIICKTHIFKNIMHIFRRILCVIKNNIVSLHQKFKDYDKKQYYEFEKYRKILV